MCIVLEKGENHGVEKCLKNSDHDRNSADQINT